jgi:hypothetical protein
VGRFLPLGVDHGTISCRSPCRQQDSADRQRSGEQSAEVWITDDAKDVRFFHDPKNGIEGTKDSVVLGPDETIAVGLLVEVGEPSAILA